MENETLWMTIVTLNAPLSKDLFQHIKYLKIANMRHGMSVTLRVVRCKQKGFQYHLAKQLLLFMKQEK